MMVPYLASAETYAHRLFGSDALSPNRRDLARCRILSAGRELTLSVPLVGGSHALTHSKSAPNPLKGASFNIQNSKFDIPLSDHGDWRRRHVAALTTAYQRTPFFDHYSPALFELISGSEGATLGSLLEAADELILSWLPQAPETEDEAFLAVSRERRGESREGLSIVDLLFRKGPEAIFSLRGALL